MLTAILRTCSKTKDRRVFMRLAVGVESGYLHDNVNSRNVNILFYFSDLFFFSFIKCEKLVDWRS